MRPATGTIVADLLDSSFATEHNSTVALGIRHVLCMPLKLVRYLDRADMPNEERRHRRALSRQPREGRAALARRARRARYAGDRSRRRDRECAAVSRDARQGADRAGDEDRGGNPARAAAADRSDVGGYFEAVGASVPCRAIGGDFFDYVDLPNGDFGFAVGDVAGKGAPAALLTAVLQGVFASQASSGSGPARRCPGSTRR